MTLILVHADGVVLGALPAYDAELPWWQETSDVVRLARDLHGVEVEVLRLLDTERAVPHGGAVTYLAEVAGPVPLGLTPVGVDLVELAHRHEPLRAAYAELGGPARSLEWARSILGTDAVAVQQRTWNLSAIWALRTPDGTVSWLKQVPTFFRHEAVVLRWLEARVPDLAPRVIAIGDEGRMLLADVPGDDLYTADAATRAFLACATHPIALAALDDVETLVSGGVPDRRGDALATWIRTTLHDRIGAHPAAALLDRLDAVLAAVAECGLPDTLVHGDAHPGNVRRDGVRLAVLDWGDSFVGNPAFDALTLVAQLDEPDQEGVLERWAGLWRDTVPGSEPSRALDLLRPVAALRSAAVYAEFLARIEPTQRRFHDADVPEQLDAAAAYA